MWNLREKIKSDTELNEYDLFIENQEFADAIMLIFFGLKKPKTLILFLLFVIGRKCEVRHN